MYWYGGIGALWWILWLLVIAGVILVWMRGRTPIRQADPAIEVLREKYAAGEMTDEDYLHRLAMLAAPGQPAPRPEPPMAHPASAA